MKYWINTVSRDHVCRGIEGGFTQASHGRKTVLSRLEKGDWIIFYSPKTDYEGGSTLQAFTAICRVIDGEPYQAEMAPGFIPWQRRVKFLPCREVPIRPLIGELDFIEDKTHWGYRFRFGMFQIPEHDFRLLRSVLIDKE